MKVSQCLPFLTRLLPVCCLLVIAAINPTTQASIMIDDFSTPQTVSPASSSSVTGPGIVGGEREVTTGSYCSVDIANQTFYGYNDFSSRSRINLQYNGTDNGGIEELGMDITAGGQYTGIEIKFLNSSSNDVIYIHIMNNAPQSNDWYSVAFSLPSSPTSLFIPFADFEIILPATSNYTAADSVDFTNVEYISFDIFIDPGSSCEIDAITIVPEPATLMLLSLGGWILRKRQRSYRTPQL